MEKCLITKHNGVVSNNSLLKVGEFILKVTSQDSPTYRDRTLTLTFNKNTTIKIVGNGYFTDTTLITNKGKELDIKANVTTKVILSNGDYDINIGNKYNLVDLNIYEEDIKSSCVYFNLEDLKYSKSLHDLYSNNPSVYGNISFLETQDFPNLYRFYASNSQIEGDLKYFSKLTALNSLNIGNNIKGDISSLVNMTTIRECIVNNKNITGDISVFKDKQNLTILNISDSSVYGDISAFKELTKLTRLSCERNKTLSGNLGDIPNNVLNIANSSSFVWTGTSRSNILGIYGATITNGLDRLLIDMANLEFKGSSSIYDKNILVYGIRTSASDAAISALQSKGMTITIIPII